MTQITREQFVTICNESIKKTRKNITIVNQLSGYKKFHKEIRDNNYLEKNVRTLLDKTDKEDDVLSKHDIIEFYGIGNCQEIADYLAVEIGKKINENDAEATIKIVSSNEEDHFYNRIEIHLLNERFVSTWEVDGWDPRVIDVSKNVNGEVKNKEFLTYGHEVETVNSFKTEKCSKQESSKNFKHKKPIEGPPERSPTPEREMLNKHPYLYNDYTIKKSTQMGKLCKSTMLGFLQKSSIWQKNQKPILKKEVSEFTIQHN